MQTERHLWLVPCAAIIALFLALHFAVVQTDRLLCINERLHNSSSIEYGKDRIKEECWELHRFFTLP